MGEVNRRETDAQVLRLFFISTAVFIVIGAVVYGVFQTEKISLMPWRVKFCQQLVFGAIKTFPITASVSDRQGSVSQMLQKKQKP